MQKIKDIDLNFGSAVLDSILTGLSTVSVSVITATDTVISAFGKLQAFIGTTTLTTTATTITTAINELVTRVLALETNTTLIGTVATPATVTTVTQHYVNKKNGVCEYALSATATMASDTTYTLETLPSGYRPNVAFGKNILLSNSTSILAHLSISTAGVVTVISRATVTAQLISINETFLT